MATEQKPPPVPTEQRDSVRRQIIDLLWKGNFSARELSTQVHIPEKEVYDHLSHIKKSAGPRQLRLITYPAACRQCGFSFVKREKLRKPGKCPACSNEQIAAPRFEIKKA